jgi:hypothetical protein
MRRGAIDYIEAPSIRKDFLYRPCGVGEADSTKGSTDDYSELSERSWIIKRRLRMLSLLGFVVNTAKCPDCN